MATDPRSGARRRFLLTATAFLAAPSLALATGSASAPHLAAAWEDETGHGIGVLALSKTGWSRLAGLKVPTRAHGLMAEAGGGVIAIARRPGDWMLRWMPGQPKAQWAWAEPGRAFNGHVAASVDGLLLYTTETDLESGAGLVGVRDAATLEKLEEWPTNGIDPHALLRDGDTLIVANGGVPTQPETGRVKRNLHLMDSSLVRLDSGDGSLRGQWRLQDRRLSLRHLARNGDLIGIALQAEHDAPDVRAAAPVLALFDGWTLRLADPHAAPKLEGYGGDITAWRDGFAVGAPRANGVARWRPEGGWAPLLGLADGCALAASDARVWAAGRAAVAELKEGEGSEAKHPLDGALRIDNHWTILPRPARS